MRTYSYNVSNAMGQIKKGTIKTDVIEHAVKELRSGGWYIMSLQPAKPFNLWSLLTKQRISTVELVDFTDHLSSMISSGTPIIEALSVYQEEENEKLTLVISDIIADIRQGQKISEALRNHPSVFSPLYIAFIEAGEMTGQLHETLEYLAKELRRQYEFQEKIKSSLTYPSLVVSVALCVILVLVFVVVPKITKLTRAMTGDLPLFTKIVAAASDFLTAFGPLIIFIGFAGIIAFIFLLKNPKTRKQIDPYLLNFPLIGSLLRKYIIARFLMVVGSCFKYGVPLITSFNTVKAVVQNSIYQEACNRIENRITKGMSLSHALSMEDQKYFPKSIVRTLRGAEKTGTVDEAMIRLSFFYEKQIDRSLKKVTDLIEPALIIVLGFVVGAIAIAVVAPIYQLSRNIR